MGGSVMATSDRIRSLGWQPMALLPPVPVLRFYVQAPGSKQILEWLDPKVLTREFYERFGGKARKFTWDLLKKETPKMSEDEDVSMIVHDFWGKFTGMEFASREIALAMAEMLIKNSCGEDFLETQLPLRISDGGDRWIVEGSRKFEDYPADETGIRSGKFDVEILKRNCQVIKFSGTGA